MGWEATTETNLEMRSRHGTRHVKLNTHTKKVTSTNTSPNAWLVADERSKSNQNKLLTF